MVPLTNKLQFLQLCIVMNRERCEWFDALLMLMIGEIANVIVT